MLATNFLDYLQFIEATINTLVASEQAILAAFRVEARAPLLGYINGILQFSDGSQLHFREFVDTGLFEPRRKYAYHYQAVDKQLVFRYDNAFINPR